MCAHLFIACHDTGSRTGQFHGLITLAFELFALHFYYLELRVGVTYHQQSTFFSYIVTVTDYPT
jgi:hypothetical protein